MRYILALLITVAISVQAQDATPPQEHLTEEGRKIVEADSQAFCMAGEPINAHGHECHCVMRCTTLTDEATGEEYQWMGEDPACMFYCAGSRRCICHADQSCPDPHMEQRPAELTPPQEHQ